MKKVIKGFVTYTHDKYNPADREFDFFTFDPRKSKNWPDTVVVCEHSIEIEVPDDFDPRPGLIAALKEKERKARADFEALCTDIRRQISQYEAIGMDEVKE